MALRVDAGRLPSVTFGKAEFVSVRRGAISNAVDGPQRVVRGLGSLPTGSELMVSRELD